MTPRSQAAVLVAVGFSVQVGLASRWAATGAEALWWALGAAGEGPPWGGLVGALPPTPLALRTPGLLLHVLAVLLLLPFATRPRRFAALVLATPALGGAALSGTATGWASGLWGIALAATLHGGPGYLVAGGAVGLGLGLGPDVASTLLVWPLVSLAALPEADRRTPWPWLGLVAAGVGVVGFGVSAPTTAAEPWGLLGQQVLRSAPLLGVAWLVSLRSAAAGATDRLARWASVPVLGGAFLSAWLGWGTPAGAVAVAWWGAALGVARADGAAGRLGDTAAWLAPVVALVAIGHIARPVVPLPRDPAAAYWLGEPLGDDAMRWAMPPGAPRHDPRAAAAPLLLADSPQTAAWIRFHTGLPARVWGEGAPFGADSVQDALFVGWGGALPPDAFVVGRARESPAYAPDGRRLGTWVWAEVSAP